MTASYFEYDNDRTDGEEDKAFAKFMLLRDQGLVPGTDFSVRRDAITGGNTEERIIMKGYIPLISPMAAINQMFQIDFFGNIREIAQRTYNSRVFSVLDFAGYGLGIAEILCARYPEIEKYDHWGTKWLNEIMGIDAAVSTYIRYEHMRGRVHQRMREYTPIVRTVVAHLLEAAQCPYICEDVAGGPLSAPIVTCVEGLWYLSRIYARQLDWAPDEDIAKASRGRSVD